MKTPAEKLTHNLEAAVRRLSKVRPLPELPDPTPEEQERIQFVMATPNFDLRGRSYMAEIIRRTPLCTGYMLFLNQRCSLAYIMHRDDVDDMDFMGAVPPAERFPIPRYLWERHPEYIRRWVFKKMCQRSNRL
jgi:hypothetical protein